MAIPSRRKTALIAACAAAFLSAALFGSGHAAASSVVADNWATRPGTTVRVLLMKANQPANAVMLLAGGHGNLNLDPQGTIGWGEDDFAVRTRFFYYDHGIAAIVPDVAADHKPPVFLAGFRSSAQQADDIRALSEQLRGMAPKVWIVAYDTGATSALNAIARGKADLIAGLVLVSPVLEAPNSTELLAGAKQALEHMPVLVVHHQSDACSAAVTGSLKDLAAAVKAPHFQLLTVSGGRSNYLLHDPFAYPEGSCNAKPAHALGGLEDAVSGKIIEWIDHEGASQLSAPAAVAAVDPASIDMPPATQLTPVSALPEPGVPNFRWVLIRGFNVQAVNVPPQVPGLPVLRLAALASDNGHTLSMRVTGLNKNQVYRIAAWVKPVAGGNAQIAADDQPDSDNPPNNAYATFDLRDHLLLSSYGAQAQDIEQHVGNWQKIWIDLRTSDGQFLVMVRTAKADKILYAGDGKIGLIWGGITVEPSE